MVDRQTDVNVTSILLFEYYKRSCGQSSNPEMHFYVLPELRDIDNKIIESNATRLIDKNLVRGGVDVGPSHSFPWITRINPIGVKLVESMVDEAKSKIPEVKNELKGMNDTHDKIMSFITYCLKSKKIPTNVLLAVKNLVL